MSAFGGMSTAGSTVGDDRWSTAKNAARNQASRNHAKEIIRSMAPYACMLTINFAHRYHDMFLQDMMNKFVRQLNGEVFKKRFQRKKECLKGVCVAEVCRGEGNLDGCLHFHFLICPCSKFDASNVEKVLLPLVRRVLRRLKDEKGRCITKVGGKNPLVQMDAYYSLGCLDNYLTKEHEYRGSEATDFMGVLDFNGTGLLLPKNRFKNDLNRVAFGF